MSKPLQQILRIVEQQRSSLGAEPRVRFDGVIDAVPDEIAEHVLASLREVTLRVLDDRVGIAETLLQWLRNRQHGRTSRVARWQLPRRTP